VALEPRVLAGWGQIFVKPRHEKHDLPPGDATDDTASSQQQHHRPPLAPHSSVSSSHRQLPLLLEPDSNLEITETLASAPAHQLQMPAFVGWRRLAAPDRFGASTKPLLVVR